MEIILRHGLGLFWILIILIGLFLISFHPKVIKLLQKWTPMIGSKELRLYLAYLFLLVSTTMLYWLLDVVVIDLPDPIVLFAFYILFLAISFGFRITLLTALLTIFLIEYYLFEPRYHINIFDHILNTNFTFIGLIISLILGNRIRRNEQKMLKEEEELRNLIQARDQFASIIAHDLKTPLTTIKLYTQAITKKFPGKKAGDMLGNSISTINKETDKLARMIDGLLDFSRIQSGKIRLKKELVNLNQICKERVEIFKKLSPQHKFIFKPNPKKAQVLGDKIILDRIITNLLSNAAKYSEPGSKIILKIQGKRTIFVIEIKDQGVGIEQNNFDKLFEPFYQEGNHKQGLGLGLFITKRLVELHHGKIWLKSKRGVGSSFFIQLPKVR